MANALFSPSGLLGIKPNIPSPFPLWALHWAILKSPHHSPNGLFLSEPVDSASSVRFSKSGCFQLFMSSNEKGGGHISWIGEVAIEELVANA
jgi:hypothetical protein